MSFLRWLLFRESQVTEDPLPDISKTGYFGCVLHKYSQYDLVTAAHKFMVESRGTAVPARGWLGKAHHMTVKFSPQIADLEALQSWFGKPIHLKVEYWVVDDHCLTVVVKPEIELPIVGVPHVTVAHSHEVNAAYSNVLLLERQRWQPAMDGLELTSYLMAVEHGNVPFWPNLRGIPLAAPSVPV